MENRVQMIYRIQPVRSISSPYPFMQEGNRMNSKDEKEKQSNPVSFNHMLLEESSRYDHRDGALAADSNSYDKYAKEVNYYTSKFDFRQ